MIRNAKGKPFTWSYTAINDFSTCPYQYAAKRFYCSVKEEQTEASIWGERVHKALEERIRDKKELPEGMTQYENWCRVLEKLPGKFYFERKYAVDQRLELCDWDAKTAYGRGIVDLLIINEERKEAVVIDYKTGKMKDDPTQLKLFCWFAVKEFPFVETFKYRYIWLKVGTPTGGEMTRREALAQFGSVVEKLKTMEQAWAEENFPMNPSGLCRGWCPVEDCVHWRAKR